MIEHWDAIAVGVGVLGLYLALGGQLWTRGWVKHRDARLRRRIDRLATVRIAGATSGSVIKIVGRAEAIEPLLEAPLTGRSAIAFVARVEIIEQVSRGPSSVTPYRREKRAQDFLVRDETGVALVRAARADVVAEPYCEADLDERQLRWLRQRRGRSRFLLFGSRTLQYFETALVPGAEVVVLGRCARPAAAADGPYRDGGEPMIAIEAPSAGAVVLTWSRETS